MRSMAKGREFLRALPVLVRIRKPCVGSFSRAASNAVTARIAESISACDRASSLFRARWIYELQRSSIFAIILSHCSSVKRTKTRPPFIVRNVSSRFCSSGRGRVAGTYRTRGMRCNIVCSQFPSGGGGKGKGRGVGSVADCTRGKEGEERRTEGESCCGAWTSGAFRTGLSIGLERFEGFV